MNGAPIPDLNYMIELGEAVVLTVIKIKYIIKTNINDINQRKGKVFAEMRI